MIMRAHIVFCLCLRCRPAACSTTSDQRTFTLQGQVQSLDPARKLVVVKHEEIKGFMPAMTMPYEVQDAKSLDGPGAGRSDQRHARRLLERRPSDEHQEGRHGAARKAAGRSAESDGLVGIRAVEAGRSGSRTDRFVDQDGKKRRFSDFKGSPVAMTFIYTRCPLADLLSADGSPFRLASEAAEGRSGAARPCGWSPSASIRPPTRRPVLQEHAKTPERRPVALDVPDRRPRRGRSVRVALRRVDRARA